MEDHSIFPFLALPLELREMIYFNIYITVDARLGDNTVECMIAQYHVPAPSIRLISKRVAAEFESFHRKGRAHCVVVRDPDAGTTYQNDLPPGFFGEVQHVEVPRLALCHLLPSGEYWKCDNWHRTPWNLERVRQLRRFSHVQTMRVDLWLCPRGDDPAMDDVPTGPDGRHHLLEDTIVLMLIEIPRLTKLRVHKLVEHKLVDLETPRLDDGESKLWVTWTKENGFVGTEPSH